MKNGRCRMHGGLSTGPRTAAGLERARQARWKDGYRSAESRALRRAAREACRALTFTLGLARAELRRRRERTVGRGRAQPPSSGAGAASSLGMGSIVENRESVHASCGGAQASLPGRRQKGWISADSLQRWLPPSGAVPGACWSAMMPAGLRWLEWLRALPPDQPLPLDDAHGNSSLGTGLIAKFSEFPAVPLDGLHPGKCRTKAE
jgi:hypothetical protein